MDLLEAVKSIVILTILFFGAIFISNDLFKNEEIDKKIIEKTEKVYKYNNCRKFDEIYYCYNEIKD